MLTQAIYRKVNETEFASNMISNPLVYYINPRLAGVSLCKSKNGTLRVLHMFADLSALVWNRSNSEKG